MTRALSCVPEVGCLIQKEKDGGRGRGRGEEEEAAVAAGEMILGPLS